MEGSSAPLEGQFAGELLELAGLSRERVREIAGRCDTSWLQQLEERGPLLELLIKEPGPTWRAQVPSKRWVAFGKALEPFLAAALEGSLPAWKAVEVGLRLLYRAPVRSADEVPPSTRGCSWSKRRAAGRSWQPSLSRQTCQVLF